MSLDTLFIIAVVLLYFVLAWRLYAGLDVILPAPKWVNILTAIMWPGFIVAILALIVLIIIAGCIFAVAFAGLLSYDIIKTMFTGKPLEFEELPTDNWEEE